MSVKERIYRPFGTVKTLIRAIKRKRLSGKEPRLFLLNIPSHGNMGDHLISIAEQSFLNTYFPGKQVVLVTSADLFFSIRSALYDVRKEDILCVTGGGFMGSLYAEEERFLKIISRYPDNKIVFFPQSFYYAPSEDRQMMIGRAAKVYASHKSLYVAAREPKSYALLQNELMPGAGEKISLVPDIALFLHTPSQNTRDGVLYCIRSDAESLQSNESIIEHLKTLIEGRGQKQQSVDTYVHRSISTDEEASEVSLMLEKFSKARLVITDRLHGMLFSVITETPVIVLDNATGKVRQVYDMCLQTVPFVRFVNDSSSLASCVDELLSIDDCTYDYEAIGKQYKPLIDAIQA